MIILYNYVLWQGRGLLLQSTVWIGGGEPTPCGMRALKEYEMITVSNLGMQFGGQWLFQHVDLQFLPGNCYGIIGANGAGKSTFLRILTGELESTSGDIHIDPDKRVNEITKAERQGFAALIKAIPLTVTGTRSFAEAIITQGGISVKDINPSTMESKLVKNLYFAGEVLDLDAMTGGFNLQIAWSTGHLAGESAGGE